MSVTHRIVLTQDDDGWWVAEDDATGVASQGKTRAAALDNLDEAVALSEGAGEPVTDDDLRRWGIDPETVTDEPTVPDAPWFDSDSET